MSDHRYGEELGISQEPTNAELAKIMGPPTPPEVGQTITINGQETRVTAVEMLENGGWNASCEPVALGPNHCEPARPGIGMRAGCGPADIVHFDECADR